MIEELVGVPLSQLTPPVLLGVAVLLLLTGRIVPRSTYLDKAQESERWRKAYETEREAGEHRDKIQEEILDISKTQYAFITATFQAGRKVREEDESDAPSP